MQPEGVVKKLKVKELCVFEGMGKKKGWRGFGRRSLRCGRIDDFNIGDTISDVENQEALPSISVDEPTMSMTFGINNSPFMAKTENLLPAATCARDCGKRWKKSGLEGWKKVKEVIALLFSDAVFYTSAFW